MRRERIKLWKRREAEPGFAIVVGRNLREAREARDKYVRRRHGEELTQKDVSKSVGIHPTQLSHFEAGRRVPSLVVFKKLCALYEVDPAQILGVRDVRIKGKLIFNHLQNQEEQDAPGKGLSLAPSGAT